MNTNIRVAIFEDNQLFREALQTILNNTPGYICCGAFPDGHQVASRIERCRPEVILMDIEMPGINGIEATEYLRDNNPDVRVLIQTVFNDAEKIFQALCAGASGYILKTDSPAKYLEAIKDVHSGGSAVSAGVAKKIVSFFSNKNVILVSPDAHDFQLSQRETELLQLMVQGQDMKSIAGTAFISYETVRTHFKSIYKKLHVSSRSEAVMKAIQSGMF